MLSKDEQRRVARYLKDYADYLWNKQDKEHSSVIKVMIKNAIGDIKNLSERLEASE